MQVQLRMRMQLMELLLLARVQLVAMLLERM